MSTRAELIDAFKRIAWLEERMKKDYASYRDSISDPEMLKILSAIEDDEIRHMNMAQRVLGILEK